MTIRYKTPASLRRTCWWAYKPPRTLLDLLRIERAYYDAILLPGRNGTT